MAGVGARSGVGFDPSIDTRAFKKSPFENLPDDVLFNILLFLKPLPVLPDQVLTLADIKPYRNIWKLNLVSKSMVERLNQKSTRIFLNSSRIQLVIDGAYTNFMTNFARIQARGKVNVRGLYSFHAMDKLHKTLFAFFMLRICLVFCLAARCNNFFLLSLVILELGLALGHAFLMDRWESSPLRRSELSNLSQWCQHRAGYNLFRKMRSDQALQEAFVAQPWILPSGLARANFELLSLGRSQVIQEQPQFLVATSIAEWIAENQCRKDFLNRPERLVWKKNLVLSNILSLLGLLGMLKHLPSLSSACPEFNFLPVLFVMSQLACITSAFISDIFVGSIYAQAVTPLRLREFIPANRHTDVRVTNLLTARGLTLDSIRPSPALLFARTVGDETIIDMAPALTLMTRRRD